MACAILQALRGRRVALIEQGSQLAPLVAGFDRKGAHFETGLHYCASLGEGEPGAFMFKRLGMEVPVCPCEADGYAEVRLLATGRRFQMAFGRERLISKVVEAFPDEKDGIVRFLDRMREEAAKSTFLNIQNGDFSSTSLFEPWSSRTLQEELDADFASPELKAILSTPTFLHGVPPDRISFALHSRISSSMYDSLWEIDGGGRTLITCFQQALERNGVEILLNRKVTHLEVQNGTKLLHSADGSIVAADECISTLHAKDFLRIAPPGLYRSGYRARALNIPETVGFLSMYALNTGEPTPPKNYFVLPDLDFKRFPPDGPQSAYHLNISGSASQTAILIALTPAAHGLSDRSDPGYQRRKAEVIQAHWEEFSSWCPELMSHLTMVAASTPATQKRYTGYCGGYGLMHDVNYSPILPVTKIPGIFLGGQSVVAPGILGTMISSFLLDKLTQQK